MELKSDGQIATLRKVLEEAEPGSHVDAFSVDGTIGVTLPAKRRTVEIAADGSARTY